MSFHKFGFGNNLKFVLAAVTLLSLFSVVQSAAEARQVELSNGRVIKNVNEIQGELKESELTVLGIIVGTSNLNDVKKVFGTDIVGNSGKGSSEVSYICFFDSSGNILAYESSRAMGGSELIVTSAYILAPMEKYTFKRECKNSTKKFASIEVAGGIKIGSNSEVIKKIRGTPSYTSKSEIIYLYSKIDKQSVYQGERMDLLKIGISSKKVSSVVVTRVGN